MAVTNCRIETAPVLTEDWDRKRTYRGTYKITTNSAMGSLAVKLGAQDTGAGHDNPLPKVWDTFSFRGDSDTGAFCQELNLNRSEKAEAQWIAAVTWQSLPPDTPDGSNPDPLQRPALYWLEFQTVTRQVQRAWNVEAITPRAGPSRPAGTLGPIVNAALQDYDDSIFEDDTNILLVIQKNFPNIPSILAIHNTYNLTLNNAPFLGAGIGQAKFIGLESSQPQHEGTITYYTVTVRIAFQNEPWYHHVVNRGYKAFTATSTKPVDIFVEDEAGGETKPTEPVLLTSDGQKLESGLGDTIAYRTRNLVDYSGLLFT